MAILFRLWNYYKVILFFHCFVIHQRVAQNTKYSFRTTKKRYGESLPFSKNCVKTLLYPSPLFISFFCYVWSSIPASSKFPYSNFVIVNTYRKCSSTANLSQSSCTHLLTHPSIHHPWLSICIHYSLYSLYFYRSLSRCFRRVIDCILSLLWPLFSHTSSSP